MSIAKKESKGWVTIRHSYYRHFSMLNEEIMTTRICNISTDFKNLKKEVKEYFEDWDGIGEIKIIFIETGPYLENYLTSKQEAYFIDKVYKFKE